MISRTTDGFIILDPKGKLQWLPAASKANGYEIKTISLTEMQKSRRLYPFEGMSMGEITAFFENFEADILGENNKNESSDVWGLIVKEYSEFFKALSGKQIIKPWYPALSELRKGEVKCRLYKKLCSTLRFRKKKIYQGLEVKEVEGYE